MRQLKPKLSWRAGQVKRGDEAARRVEEIQRGRVGEGAMGRRIADLKFQISEFQQCARVAAPPSPTLPLAPTHARTPSPQSSPQPWLDQATKAPLRAGLGRPKSAQLSPISARSACARLRVSKLPNCQRTSVAPTTQKPGHRASGSIIQHIRTVIICQYRTCRERENSATSSKPLEFATR